jgi:hypothetical protein
MRPIHTPYAMRAAERFCLRKQIVEHTAASRRHMARPVFIAFAHYFLRFHDFTCIDLNRLCGMLLTILGREFRAPLRLR